MKSTISGALGEVYAARYLRKQGYKILQANYRCRFGEIDIIASNQQYICFIEVKTRGPKAIGTPSEAVDRFKQKKLLTTALQYIGETHCEQQPRFDVIEVYTDKNNKPSKLNHIENAFNGDDIHASF